MSDEQLAQVLLTIIYLDSGAGKKAPSITFFYVSDGDGRWS